MFKILIRRYSSGDLLAKLSRLVRELRGTTKHGEKFAIIQTYPETHDFLRFFIDCGPLYIGKPSIDKDIIIKTDKKKVPTDLIELMKILSERRATGYQAIQLVKDFIDANVEYKELVLNIIERNLKIGMGHNLLDKALKGNVEPIIDPSSVDARHVTPSSTPKRTFPITSKDLPIALGLPLQHPSVKLGTDGSDDSWWLISRKLDGIRCLAHFERGQQLILYTRAGNRLENLPEIHQELCLLVREIKDKYPEMNDFYIDGELCVLGRREESIENNNTDALVDDFRSALSIVLSHPTGQMKIDRSRLIFFIFDLIDEKTLGSTILSKRLARIEEAIQKPKLQQVKLLTQHRTQDPFVFRDYLNAGKRHNWEGLILRKDVPHVAKRTKNIIKIKDFYEAEFDIVDYRLEKMQIVENGRMAEDELLSAVKVKFGTNDVWVGSGFSLAERKRFAKDLGLLMNSQVTIRYFQESSNNKNDLKSLRFPTIKAIYPGKRSY